MADILGFLRAAIQPAAEARTGVLQGEANVQAKAQATARQSLLDQLKVTLDTAAAARDNAAAAKDARPPIDNTLVQVQQPDGSVQWIPRSQASGTRAPRPVPAAPHTIATSKGIVQWDPETGTYTPTGYQAPISPNTITPGERAATTERTNAATQLNADLKDVPRPSRVPKPSPQMPQPITRDPKTNEPIGSANPAAAADPTSTPQYKRAVSDSLAYEQNTLGPDRARLRAATAPLGTTRGGGGSDGPAGSATTAYQQATDNMTAATTAYQQGLAKAATMPPAQRAAFLQQVHDGYAAATQWISEQLRAAAGRQP